MSTHDDPVQMMVFPAAASVVSRNMVPAQSAFPATPIVVAVGRDADGPT